MLEVKEYLDANGHSPYRVWFERLNAEAAAKITVAVERMVQGNLSNTEDAGEGVLERKISFGPGYRIYFGRDGEQLTILVGGGSKKGQSRDIAAAKVRWQDYKARKRQGER